ncbi:MAG TPA: cation diffusion facilitator family transporter [Rhizomicrobium sp.]|jgi:cobalt-zinc-cadmium efflux system protein|nr:cation diffusion facilitator family transporter [Rhizomicrobium sp.]
MSHAGHSHAHNHDHAHGVTDSRRVGIAFAIIFVFMLIEVAGGIVSGSLALLADAGHMVSDAAALGMSWIAIQVGKRPADPARSFGYRRIEVLAAFVNGCVLFVIAAGIAVEAVLRLRSPAPVLGRTMLIVAVAGLVANFIAFRVLQGGSKDDLNMRSAWLHVLSDMLGFVGAIAAAVVILMTGWTPIDPILSLLVTVLILRSAWQVVGASAHILLEGTPVHLDAEAMARDLAASVPGVADVHHVHIWSLTSQQAHVTLHARCVDNNARVIAAINARLKDKYGIAHSTIQIDVEDCPDEDCAEVAPAAQSHEHAH